MQYYRQHFNSQTNELIILHYSALAWKGSEFQSKVSEGKLWNEWSLAVGNKLTLLYQREKYLLGKYSAEDNNRDWCMMMMMIFDMIIQVDEFIVKVTNEFVFG